MAPDVACMGSRRHSKSTTTELCILIIVTAAAAACELQCSLTDTTCDVSGIR